MFNFVFESAAWQLVSQSDIFSKLIILFLLVLSILCVAITIFKIISFGHQKKEMKLLLRKIRQSGSFNEVVLLSREFKDSVGGKFLTQSINDLQNLTSKPAEQSEEDFVVLTPKDEERLDLMVSQNVNNLLMEEERYLPVLGTSANVSPLIGLFGTIWGLIHAFISISQEKSADIAIVAPGIAEALLTTLVGLIVAIPATIAFNFLSNELRKIEAHMDELSNLFLVTVKHTFTR
jgi:biopolymer transport protein TolQ